MAASAAASSTTRQPFSEVAACLCGPLFAPTTFFPTSFWIWFPHLVSVHRHMHQQSLQTGELPAAFKIAALSPILEKSNPNQGKLHWSTPNLLFPTIALERIVPVTAIQRWTVVHSRIDMALNGAFY